MHQWPGWICGLQPNDINNSWSTGMDCSCCNMLRQLLASLYRVDCCVPVCVWSESALSSEWLNAGLNWNKLNSFHSQQQKLRNLSQASEFCHIFQFTKDTTNFSINFSNLKFHFSEFSQLKLFENECFKLVCACVDTHKSHIHWILKL